MTVPGRESGFTLVEVTLAIGVVAFCILALYGLLPVGVNSNQSALRQTVANNIARVIVADLQSTPSAANLASQPGTITSPIFGFTIPSAGQPPTSTPETVYFGESGNATGGLNAAAVAATGTASEYRATLAFTPPSLAGTRTATSARILITWPALADPAPASWPSKYAGSYETIISLDRN